MGCKSGKEGEKKKREKKKGGGGAGGRNEGKGCVGGWRYISTSKNTARKILIS